MQGSKYEETKDLSATEIAKLIRADIKRSQAEHLPGGLPRGMKVSVRVRRATWSHAIDVDVTALPEGFQVLNEERVRAELANPHQFIEEFRSPRYAPEMTVVLDALRRIHRAYNYDRSDIQSDCFDVRYWGDVGVAWELERDARAKIAAEAQESLRVAAG